MDISWVDVLRFACKYLASRRMFQILIDVLEDDDNENWVIGVVDQVVCTGFEVLEEVINVVDWVVCADFKVLEEVSNWCS